MKELTDKFVVLLGTELDVRGVLGDYVVVGRVVRLLLRSICIRQKLDPYGSELSSRLVPGASAEDQGCSSAQCDSRTGDFGPVSDRLETSPPKFRSLGLVA